VLRYLVRLDDITPYMSRNRFSAVREVLDRYGIKPIIGVVPDCRDECICADESDRFSEDEYSALLSDLIASGWTVAMHGTNHVYSTEDAGLLGINPFSEFAGTSYETQYTKLRQGRELLKRLGIETSLFMAPGHSFDANTLKALRMTGFSAVTDGLYESPYIRDDILFIPCTLVSYSKMKGIDTICLHTNNMSGADIAELEKFLSKNADCAISYDEAALRAEAVAYDEGTAHAEAMALLMRENRNRAANSARLSGFLSATYHPNTAVKWIKRVFMSPLLLTGRYDSKEKEQ